MLNLFRRGAGPKRRSTPEGRRGYAVGDVHGCLDRLRALLEKIEEDHRARGPAEGYLVFLGDLVDRGPDSRGVVEFLHEYKPAGLRPVFLMGNHEEFFLRVLDGEVEIVGQWLTYGGRELATSYGLEEGWLDEATPEAIAAAVARAVPQAHRAFVAGFGDSFRFGDYLFVHAGIRPGVVLDQQVPSDLRWIRKGFVNDRSEHGVLVVHGHTITPEPEIKPNRIGIDTGAYKGGALTALGVESDQSWFLEAR